MFKSLLSGFALLVATPLLAGELPPPAGDVILTIDGAIASTNAEGRAVFDLSMLDHFYQHTTVAQTPWFTGEQSFSGVLLNDLLVSLGARGAAITVTALNDYSAEIPLSDIDAMPVILASRINEKTLSPRDKGPLMIVYPFDKDEGLYNEVIFGRSVWQVKSITVH